MEATRRGYLSPPRCAVEGTASKDHDAAGRRRPAAAVTSPARANQQVGVGGLTH